MQSAAGASMPGSSTLNESPPDQAQSSSNAASRSEVKSGPKVTADKQMTSGSSTASQSARAATPSASGIVSVDCTFAQSISAQESSVAACLLSLDQSGATRCELGTSCSHAVIAAVLKLPAGNSFSEASAIEAAAELLHGAEARRNKDAVGFVSPSKRSTTTRLLWSRGSSSCSISTMEPKRVPYLLRKYAQNCCGLMSSSPALFCGDSWASDSLTSPAALPDSPLRMRCVRILTLACRSGFGSFRNLSFSREWERTYGTSSCCSSQVLHIGSRSTSLASTQR
mmetsp:Transcript_29551/g.53686  ORF Transcript_29551/g.53686 Transcript_29551/m.53686 type:complete len:283 (+) Transcript_29551:760-1608(+)